MSSGKSTAISEARITPADILEPKEMSATLGDLLEAARTLGYSLIAQNGQVYAVGKTEHVAIPVIYKRVDGGGNE